MKCNCIKDHSLKECEHFSVPIDFLCRVFADVSPFEAARKEGKKIPFLFVQQTFGPNFKALCQSHNFYEFI